MDLLRKEGNDVRFQPFINESGWQILYTKGNILQKAAAILGGFVRRASLFFGPLFSAQVVFIHREATPVGPPVVEFLIARVWRKPVIYDFDDAIWLPNTSEENRIAAWLKWHAKVGSICKWSYRISAGNRFLADYARKHNEAVVVNPTTVDTRVHKPQPIRESNQEIILGWTGTHSTLRYLHEFETVWMDLVSRFGPRINLLVIADRHPGFSWPQLEFVPWSKENEVEVLHRIDIGLMPLTDDAWAEGKCGLKALQYMALAIPTVASPVGVNKHIIQHGNNGLLCQTHERWLAALVELIEQPSERQRLGAAGRQTVETGFSVDSNASNFVSLFR